MTVMGIDIATSTGWCILKDNQLVKYGMINIPSEMNLFQRIKFFENNLNQILIDNNPDEIHIEDVILGISGAKTLAYLGRLNGVAISTCYNKVGDHIKLYTPTTWKSHSFPNLNGMAKKAEIQVAVIKHFNLISKEDIDIITKPLNDFNNQDDILKIQYETIKRRIDTCKKVLARKKTSEQDKSVMKESILTDNSTLNDLKKTLIKRKKEIENVYKQVSISLTAKCGLTADVSDSIGIAYCNI